VPTNPETRQTLYQKHILQPAPQWFNSRALLGPDFIVHVSPSRNSTTRADDEGKANKITGFLKPFATYHCPDYSPDPIFDRIQAAMLHSFADVSKLAAQVMSTPEDAATLAKILGCFVVDEEALGLGMICRIGDKAHALLFRK
jgi:hypothetical protein